MPALMSSLFHPPKNMKNKKQNKIHPTDTASFAGSAHQASLETARRISVKLGCTFAEISELDQASHHAISVFKRTESLNGRYSWKDNEKNISYEVIDVLVNPSKVPAYAKAKELYDQVAPKIQDAQAKSASFSNPWFASLSALVKDSQAISTVFRTFVRTGGDAKVSAESFVAVSNRRNDRNGELNAVRFGSKTGVDRLLAHPIGNCAPGKRYGNHEKWAGVVDSTTPVNIERIVESAVELSEPYNCVSQATVDELAKHLTDAEILGDILEGQSLDARKAHVARLAGEIEALGLKLVNGPTSYDRVNYKATYTVAVIPAELWTPDCDAPHLIGCKEALEALHKALIK